MAMTEQNVVTAEARMAASRQAGHVVSARYDADGGRVVISLNTGMDLVFPPALAEGLAGACAADLSRIEISPSGLGLHWPALDADLHVPSLLQGLFGSPAWMAAQMGRKGGEVRSPAKAETARSNGRKGGRPRKSAMA